MKIKKFCKSIKRMAVAIFCMSLFFTASFRNVYAEGKAVILQAILKEGNICLFLNGLGNYETVSGQIGREAIEIVDMDAPVSGHTIILVDNSLSVTKDNFAKSKEIIGQFLDNKAEDEKISLAVYGTDIQYLVENETDATKIKEALDSITNEDKDTYLTDVLYDELQKLEQKTEYTRFIVITDGVDNKEIGYTKEELSAYLKKNPYPVYALGCKYKDNDEQLKNLFAISRATNADYFLLDDYEEYEEIVQSLCESITCVEIKVPDELRDGSTKNILLTFEGEYGTIEVSDELSMPFGLREEVEEVQEEEEPVAEEEPVIEEEPEEEPVIEETPIQEPEVIEPQPEESSIDMVSVCAGIVIVIALVVLVIVNLRKKKGKEKKKQSEVIPKVEDIGTIMIGSGIEEEPEDEGATVFLDARDRADDIIVLRDSNDSSKVFRYPISDKIVIGRKYQEGVNIVLNYESTVSAKHCEICKRGDRFYVKDLNSSNKTFLNGRQIDDYAEFTSGAALQMGNLKMTVEIEKAR